MSIKDYIENPHYVYLKYFNFWNFLLESYEGGIDYTQASVKNSDSNIIVKANGKKLENTLKTNLFKHPKERTEDFNRRVDRSYYYNYCSPVIDIYVSHLFSTPIESNFGGIEDILKRKENNIDKMSSNLTEFRKNLSELSQIYGHCFVLVDTPKDQGEITLADRIEKDSFPYLCLLSPQQVLNWSLDAYGSPNWVIVAEQGNDDSLGESNVQYKLWTKEKWVLYNSSYEMIEEKDHGLGEVPIVCIYNKKSKKQRSFLGISQLADIGYIARDIYNLSSQLNQVIEDQTFAILTLQGKASDFSAAEVGTNKALIYPNDTNTPQYISPQPANAEIIMRQIDQQIEKIYQIAKLEPGNGSYKGGQATEKSGVAKAWDFQQTNSSLVQKASNLEDAEIKIWSLFAKWEGKDWDGSVEYPKEFNVKSLNEDIENALNLNKLNLGEEFNKRVKKEIVKKKYPRMSKDDLQEIEDEIDNNINVGSPNASRIANRLNLTSRDGNNGVL